MRSRAQKIFTRSALVAACAGVATVAFALPALAGSFPWTMRGVKQGFQSRLWDAGGGNTSIEVSHCKYLSPGAGGSQIGLAFYQNLAWRPDRLVGTGGYRCTDGYGGNNAWNNQPGGRYYFYVQNTDNPYGFNADGSTHYP